MFIEQLCAPGAISAAAAAVRWPTRVNVCVCVCVCDMAVVGDDVADGGVFFFFFFFFEDYNVVLGLIVRVFS